MGVKEVNSNLKDDLYNIQCSLDLINAEQTLNEFGSPVIPACRKLAASLFS